MDETRDTRAFEREQRRRAEREPVEEAGGGEAEGFEQAEKDLIEHAENLGGAPDPHTQRFTPEKEDAGDVHGEADSADPDDA